jgi:preprotein translocase subunit SecF
LAQVINTQKLRFRLAPARSFAFAMLVGVITGTYSSIFIAMPVLYDLRNKNEDKLAEAVKK